MKDIIQINKYLKEQLFTETSQPDIGQQKLVRNTQILYT
jgi:hypothetical protein